MNFVSSWKALYHQLAAQQPELKDFGSYAKLVNHRDTASQIITMLSNMPHSAALVICPGHKIKIIHHVHHDIKTPVIPEGTNEVWALMWSGATVAAVTIDMTSVRDCEGITPKFADLNQAGDIEALHSLTGPNAQEVMNDPSLKFKGKTVMALPPFLTKTLMDADSEDPFQLFRATCKALNDFDES
jgi:hypothetical protein